ncbi:unnamed protein product [Heterosigma akashiwo]
MKGASAPLAFTALVVLCIVGLKSFQSRNDVVVQKEYLQTTELDGVGLLQARIVQRVVDESADTQNLRKTVYSSSSSADSALPVAEVVKVAPVSAATAVAATSSSKQSAENSQQEDIKKTGTDKNVRSFHSLRDYLKTLQDVSGGEGKVTVKSGTAGAKIKDISSTSASSSADETPAAKPASVVQPKPAAQPTATAVVPQQQSSSPAASWAPIIAHSKETTSSSARFPKQSDKYINNLFAHPKVLSAFEKIKSSAHDYINEICFGPDNNMDVYINEELMQRDLMGPSNGYTVFDLDCRDKDANPLIAFILVMDQYGAIVNVYRPANRAESVVMLDTDRVLFSVIGTKGGVQVWNWRTDEVVALPFEADSHTVQYSHAQGLYFGLARAGAANRNAPSVAQAFDARGTVVWSYEQPYSHINWLTVDGDYAYLSLRSDASLIKVDRRTNAIVWSLGGKNSDFRITDLDGRVYTKEMWHDKADFDMWNHQHKFSTWAGLLLALRQPHRQRPRLHPGELAHVVVLQVDGGRGRRARCSATPAGDIQAHLRQRRRGALGQRAGQLVPGRGGPGLGRRPVPREPLGGDARGRAGLARGVQGEEPVRRGGRRGAAARARGGPRRGAPRGLGGVQRGAHVRGAPADPPLPGRRRRRPRGHAAAAALQHGAHDGRGPREGHAAGGGAGRAAAGRGGVPVRPGVAGDGGRGAVGGGPGAAACAGAGQRLGGCPGCGFGQGRRPTAVLLGVAPSPHQL